jgi:hypothetical protein
MACSSACANLDVKYDEPAKIDRTPAFRSPRGSVKIPGLKIWTTHGRDVPQIVVNLDLTLLDLPLQKPSWVF